MYNAILLYFDDIEKKNHLGILISYRQFFFFIYLPLSIFRRSTYRLYRSLSFYCTHRFTIVFDFCNENKTLRLYLRNSLNRNSPRAHYPVFFLNLNTYKNNVRPLNKKPCKLIFASVERFAFTRVKFSFYLKKNKIFRYKNDFVPNADSSRDTINYITYRRWYKTRTNLQKSFVLCFETFGIVEANEKFDRWKRIEFVYFEILLRAFTR